MMLDLLAQRVSQVDTTGLLILAIGPGVIGLLLFIVGFAVHDRGGPNWVKFLAILPPAWGSVLGWKPFTDVQSQVYKDFNYVGRNEELLHMGCFLVNVLAVVVFLVAAIVINLRMQSRKDDF